MQILEAKLRLNMHVKKKQYNSSTLHATFLFCHSAAIFTFEKICVLTFILIYICVFICILDIWNCFIFRLFAMENLRSCLIFEIPLRIFVFSSIFVLYFIFVGFIFDVNICLSPTVIRKYLWFDIHIDLYMPFVCLY